MNVALAQVRRRVHDLLLEIARTEILPAQTRAAEAARRARREAEALSEFTTSEKWQEYLALEYWVRNQDARTELLRLQRAAAVAWTEANAMCEKHAERYRQEMSQIDQLLAQRGES
jgi:hypothetical protein